jgi:drug/metabolite transporter (DMT)-like permease
MSWKDWICIISIILGIILFLYGANYYDQTTGWAGVILFIGGIVAIVLLYVYSALNKKEKEPPVAP